MSARLTPERVADRELERLARRESALLAELQSIDLDRARWQAVLDAAREANGHGPAPVDDGVGAE